MAGIHEPVCRNDFQIQEGRRLCLEAPCVFRSSKIASATLVFFKIQYQPSITRRL